MEGESITQSSPSLLLTYTRSLSSILAPNMALLTYSPFKMGTLPGQLLGDIVLELMPGMSDFPNRN